VTGERKRHSAKFTATVALDAIRGEQPIAQLAAKHGVHQTMINAWKKQAIEGVSGVFSGKAEAAEAAREGEIDQFHAKIDQVVVEREFLRRASGRSVSGGGGRMIEPNHPTPPITRQCGLVGIRRSAFTEGPWTESAENLALMRALDEPFRETPWYGSRQKARRLCRHGHAVGRKRVRRPMARMGLAG
jgi:transposase